jgi:GTP-binding protein EngB required for normal cell division
MLRAAQGTVDANELDDALVIEAARVSPKREAAESLLRAALAKAAPGAVTARLSAALGQHLAEGGRAEEARALGTSALATAADDPVVLGGWRVIAEAAGDPREALRAAARAAELGAAAPPEVLVRLALAAGDREALARVAIPAEHPLAQPLRAFLDGHPGEDDVVRLGALAPSAAGRRFLARALAPPAPPEGNLFALLEFARDLAAHTGELAPLFPAAARAAEAVDRPLLVAVMGEFNAGKSSFVNALCGEEVAPVGVTPTTATINVLRYGPPGARVLYHDGRAEDLSAAALADFLAGLGDDAAAVRMVEIFFPLDVLRRVEVVDTPGLNSLRPEHERVARGFLTEADAIIWLFALGQAAKASERDALGLAHGAHKRVLGVLNKADQADASELERLLAYVRSAMGDRIEALLPLSARDAVRARMRGDEALLGKSGLPALLEALEERFFREARALKRQTALTALARFGDEARALLASSNTAAEPTADLFARRRQALAAQRAALEGALAAERIGLRARLDQAFRHAAAEVLEFVRPRRWPFGERRAEAADEEFLFDLLDDAVVQASEATRLTLEAAAVDGPAIPISAAIERFRAYARGVLAGGLVSRFLHEQLPSAGGRVELAVLQRSLARSAPDGDSELIAPLAADIDTAFARAAAALADEELRTAMRTLVREERFARPLAALASAVAALG